ncbi:hypothetical protein C2G38_2035773 [Gigaspora rosea]|uniref:SWIM-type domain-containing protein n=1 Tax=Gigaspora rosea TaxID=44941 RepID=A0A397VDG5_9GLOM|nr:hypothetical protein C2G38_2035773 [Gigaspora rosea]
MVWRPLLPNLQCIQVPLTKVPSVLDLYTFDTISSGGSRLGEGYKILPENCTNRCRTLSKTLDTPANQVQPTSIQFAPNLEPIQNALKYDKKLHYPCISKFEKICSIMDDYEAEGTVIAKQYGVKDTQDPKEQAMLLGVASTIMPVLLTKYLDLLALDSTGRHNSLNFPNTAFMVRSDEPRGRVVATFVSDKETIPVVDLMFESGCWVLLDYYINACMPPKFCVPTTLLFLQVFSHFFFFLADALKEWFTKNLNDQCFRDRVFYQFRFVKRSRDQEEFDQRKTILLDAKKLQAAVGIANLVVAETIASYFQRYWFGDWVDTWPDYKRNDCPMKMNMLLESYFKKDMILHYLERYTKSLHSNLEKIVTSMHVDSGEIERFWRGEDKPPTISKLHRKRKKVDTMGELLYKKNLVQDVNEENSQYNTAELDVKEENSQHNAAELDNGESLIDKCDIKQTKTLYVTRRSGKFACPCGFYVIRGHDCQNIVAVRLFIDKVKLQNNAFNSHDDKPKLQWSADESVASSSLESYLRQKDANGHKKDELKLPEKKGPKNKRKS